MSSSFGLLGVESHDFSHAEKERTACKAEEIHKMTTIFTQNGPRLSSQQLKTRRHLFYLTNVTWYFNAVILTIIDQIL